MTSRISTNRFSYSKERNEFCTEASDLKNESFSRRWPDACDIGFDLVSERTGRVVRLVETDEVRDREGELMYNVFEAIREDKKLFDGRVIILND